MVRKVNLPNGKVGNFPDEMSNEDIEAVLQKQFPPQIESEDKAAFRYAVKDPLIGLLNFGSKGSASLNNLAAELGKKLGYSLPKQEATDFSGMFGIPEEQKNSADRLMQFAPEIAAAMAAPETELGPLGDLITKIPRAGKYLKTGLGNAISQGLLAASQSPQEQGAAALEAGGIAGPFSALSKATLEGSPSVRALSRALMGVGGGALGYFGAKGVGAPEPFADIAGFLGAFGGHGGVSAKRRAAENVLEGVEGTPYQESLDAAKRLGLSYITPAEASANPFTGGVQGTLGKTEKGARLLYEKGKERGASEENAIENLFSNVFPKTLEERKNTLYKSAETKEVPDTVLKEFRDNEIFKTALAHVKKEPAYKEKLKNVPENSVQYLGQVKEAMDDMIEKAPKKEGAIIRNTKNRMVERLDAVSPEYKEARQLAERGIVRREIEDLFNKKDETGTNLFKSLLSNKRDYGNLQKKFKRLEETASTPEQIESMKSAQQQLEDMKLIFGRLINIPTAKTAEALARRGAPEGHGSMQEAMRYFKQLLSSGKYDKAAVELITNPKWADELEKLKHVTKTSKMLGQFHNLMGRVGAQTIGQE